MCFLTKAPIVLAEQNSNSIHSPYTTDVPSNRIELSPKLTKKADKPVFNPTRIWFCRDLLATRYPATAPPSITTSVENISSHVWTVFSSNSDFTAYVKNSIGALARNPPARYSSKLGPSLSKISAQPTTFVLQISKRKGEYPFKRAENGVALEFDYAFAPLGNNRHDD